eukprot:6465026-Amphidinium_carterae.2
MTPRLPGATTTKSGMPSLRTLGFQASRKNSAATMQAMKDRLFRLWLPEPDLASATASTQMCSWSLTLSAAP